MCVLGALRNREAYGYELARMLENAGMGPIMGGTLYPVLSRLETDGLLVTFWQASDQGPNRKYYRLTAAGEEFLTQAAREWVNFSRATTRVMVSGLGRGEE